MAVTLMRLSGAKELEALLKQLPRTLAVEALEKSALAGALVIRDEARRRVPRGPGGGKDFKGRPRRPGTGRRSVAVIKVRDSGGKFTYSVGLRRRSRGFYLRFLEFGTGPHAIRAAPGKFLLVAGGRFVKEVLHPGVPARPWLRPALDAGRAKAIATMGESLAASIERLLGSRTYIRGFRVA